MLARIARAKRCSPRFLVASFLLGGIASLAALGAGLYVLSVVVEDVPYIHHRSTVLAARQFGTFVAHDASVQQVDALPPGAVSQVVADGLVEPVALAQLPDGLLITERGGAVRHVPHGGGGAETVLTVPDVGSELSMELGLLGIAVRPAGPRGVEVYLYHTVSDGKHVTKSWVERFRWQDGRLVDPQLVTEIDFGRDVKAHVAGGLAFGADGMLYVSVGDTAGLSAKSIAAQDLHSPFGVVLRLNPDGSVPPDNPFVRDQYADPRIYAYGLRNPFGLTVDPATGAIWVSDAGPASADELDRVLAGRNYGWPIAVGWAHQMPFELPAAAFDEARTPTGLVVYHGGMFPEWEGDLLFCSFNIPVLHRIAAIDIDSAAGPAPIRALPDAPGCVTDVEVAPDGSLYLLDLMEGRVLCLTRGE